MFSFLTSLNYFKTTVQVVKTHSKVGDLPKLFTVKQFVSGHYHFKRQLSYCPTIGSHALYKYNGLTSSHQTKVHHHTMNTCSGADKLIESATKDMSALSNAKCIADPDSRTAEVTGQAMNEAREIFYHAVSSVLPQQMIWSKLHYNPNTLTLTANGLEYKLNSNLYVVGFGKAVLGMARALEDCIGDQIVKGVISVPAGIQQALSQAGKQDMLLMPSTRINVIEGAANNLPDASAHQAALEITEIVKEVGQGDVLVVLVSGGGSALLPAPEPPVSLEDILCLTKLMSRSGASIMDLNTVRKHIDILKGGGLAELAYPAKVISLILSDVIGDPLDFIASGPTVPDSTTPQDVLDLFSKLSITESVPETILKLIQGKVEQTSVGPMSTNTKCARHLMDWSYVQNILVGTNKIACEASCIRSLDFGYLPYILSTELQGEAREVGKWFARLGHCLHIYFQSQNEEELIKLKALENSLLTLCIAKEKVDEIVQLATSVKMSRKQGICLVAGGETTVNVRGEGKGGRNQEMAVSAAVELDKKSSELVKQRENPSFTSVAFLSAGTDGQDGPTSAAGGVVCIDFVSHAFRSGLKVEDYLARNDTHTLLSKISNGTSLVVTGLTGTNVMDIHVLLVKTFIKCN
ncbi:unnamed protein product [Lymnaea stagnalis]|uniref:Glycerate kinase n=1 Tax=Lymnaea stagnalis TaxID=6523 RepID=A0AAV2IS09_LYMST